MRTFERDAQVSDWLHYSLKESGFFDTLAQTIGATDLVVPTEKSIIIDGDVFMKDVRGNQLVISEKSQSKFINRPIPTFTLELGYFARIDNEGTFRLGWLFNDKKVTHYMFIWILQADHDADIISSYKEFKKVRICMIKRSEIFKMIADAGVSEEELYERTGELINNPPQEVKYNKYTEDLRQGLMLVQSLGYYERPVNLKVDFALYQKYGDFTIDYDIEKRLITKVEKWSD